MNFIIRWIVTAVAAAVAVWIVPGITTVGSDSTMALAVFALALSFINACVKPIVQLIGLPITVLTLGIFYLVINALMLELAAGISAGLFGSGIAVASFGSALFGSIVISLVSAFVNGLIGNDD